MQAVHTHEHVVTDEEKAFTCCYGDLQRGMSSPEMVSVDLYSQGILTAPERDMVQNLMLTMDQRTGHLLSYMEAHIRRNRRAFHVFLSILRNEPAFQHIADRLEGALKGVVSICFPLLPVFVLCFCTCPVSLVFAQCLWSLCNVFGLCAMSLFFVCMLSG